MAITRVEDASLAELGNIKLEMFPRGFSDNAVVLIGSSTRMLRAGSAGYAHEWVKPHADIIFKSPMHKFVR